MPPEALDWWPGDLPGLPDPPELPEPPALDWPPEPWNGELLPDPPELPPLPPTPLGSPPAF
jgi:hypothetical protein